MGNDFEDTASILSVLCVRSQVRGKCSVEFEPRWFSKFVRHVAGQKCRANAVNEVDGSCTGRCLSVARDRLDSSMASTLTPILVCPFTSRTSDVQQSFTSTVNRVHDEVSQVQHFNQSTSQVPSDLISVDIASQDISICVNLHIQTVRQNNKFLRMHGIAGDHIYQS